MIIRLVFYLIIRDYLSLLCQLFTIIWKYLTIILSNYLWLFVIIWWLFDLSYLMIIWSYLMIIWNWLFVIICYYSMIIRSELFVIIVIIRWLFGLSYSWLFVIIWCQGKQQIGQPASLSKDAWHCGTPWGWHDIAAFEVLPGLHILVVNYSLLCRARFDTPMDLPTARSSFFVEVADPAVTQYLTVTSTQVMNILGDVFAFGSPYALRNVIFNANLK